VFGEIDEELYKGDLLYTPIVKKWYYEVVITDVAVDGDSLALDCKKLGVPDDFWYGRQMMCWNYDRTPWEEFPDMSISLLSSLSSSKETKKREHVTKANDSYDATLNRQRKRSRLNTLYLRETIEHGPIMGQHCYKFAITRAERGTVIGAVIMEGFYVVFDRENVQVGFAATTCGAEGRLNPRSEVSGPFSRDPIDCEYVETESSDTALLTVAYVMAGVCGLCLLPIFILLGQASCKRRREQRLLNGPEYREYSDNNNSTSTP
ncbi:predicted protein, partial [Nematostella vectensis]